MEKKFYRVYKMSHPSTPRVVYIGITSVEPQRRLFQHISALLMAKLRPNNDYKYHIENINTAKSQWILSLLEQGLCPLISELFCEVMSYKEAHEWELKFIRHHCNLGDTVLNISGVPKEYRDAKRAPSVLLLLPEACASLMVSDTHDTQPQS